MKEIYLDSAATSRPLESVITVMSETLRDCYGNPSSLHKKGLEAENKLKEAKENFAHYLGAKPQEIFFTSGGTESNNLSILGAAEAYKRRGKKIITSSIEHPSVREVFNHLKAQGFEMVVIPVSAMGIIDQEALLKAVDEETILVSVMHVNNEVGAIQPIEQIGRNLKAKAPQVIFHVDAVQSFGKVPIQVNKAQIDLLSISSHKFYGPKGVGVLYKNERVRLVNRLYGGGQQKNLRSGTENVPAIAGMNEAATYVMSHFNQIQSHIYTFKKTLGERILESIEDTILNGPSLEEGAPHILNIGFKDVRSEVLLHALEAKGIYVSSGSACASNKKPETTTLKEIGKNEVEQDQALRFSFGQEVVLEDIEYIVKTLEEAVLKLRKYKVVNHK